MPISSILRQKIGEGGYPRPVQPRLPIVSHTPEVANSQLDVEAQLEMLRRVLSQEEIVVLSRYLFHREVQREIGEALGLPRRTVARRIATGIQRLKAVGVCVALPGKGRRPAKMPLRLCEPASMTRLVTKSFDGVTTGAWIDASRKERPRDENDKESE